MRHIMLISGKDSLATAIVQQARAPDLPYEFIHNEVGWDLPETLEWLSRVQTAIGKPILNVGDDLTRITMDEGWLPGAKRRFCTRLAKIKPLQDFLGKDPAIIYLGLRFDEPGREGFDAPFSQTASYPLRELGYGVADVWRICSDANLLPPAFHWPWMENRVRELLGPNQPRLELLDPWESRQLFAWRSRSNCDRCWGMRQYELIGLSEFHPDRFIDACQMEDFLGRDRGSGTTYTWHRGYRLASLTGRAHTIKERRAKAIAKYIETGRQQFLFADSDDEPDLLSVVSCGLLCGK